MVHYQILAFLFLLLADQGLVFYHSSFIFRADNQKRKAQKNQNMEILQPYRKKIDDLDKDIIDLLKKRYDIIDEVSVIKKQHNIAPALQDRIDEVRNNAGAYASSIGLDGDFIAKIWQQMIDHSCQQEQSFIDEKRSIK